jgi:glycosyltransferase involved in cell wall biosynthesis
VLSFASNKPHKNLVRLVEAWAIVKGRSQCGDSHLVIAGHWDKRFPEARIRADALGLGGCVHWAGPIAEPALPAVYAGATLSVFPSLYEGFGLPVLEAMACGAPVVCSNASSLPEVAGDAALQVNPLDVDALAVAIARVLADEGLQQTLRTKGLAQAARFSWGRAARETRAVYAQVVQSR